MLTAALEIQEVLKLNPWLSALVLSVSLSALSVILVFLTNKVTGIPTGPKTLIIIFLCASFAWYFLIAIVGVFSNYGIPGVFSSNGIAGFISWIVYVVLAFMVLMWLAGVRAKENLALQERRDRRAEALITQIEKLDKGVDVPAYALYLRAFNTTNELASQGGKSGLPGKGGGEYVDFETILEKALEPEPLIALGAPGEMIGAGRIASSDEDWRALVAKLARFAEVILLLPSDHKGTLWEIAWLKQNNYLSNCIWIMPEAVGKHHTWRSIRISTSPVKIFRSVDYDPASEWSRAAEGVKTLGIELPRYENPGMLFVVGPYGRMRASHPLALSLSILRVAKVRKGVRLLKEVNKRARQAIPSSQ